ncbi:hypothetical protein QL285_013216 [Trifolium repens]|nr:hypothetical protein QL285_013216 [Trifolium repens]
MGRTQPTGKKPLRDHHQTTTGDRNRRWYGEQCLSSHHHHVWLHWRGRVWIEGKGETVDLLFREKAERKSRKRCFLFQTKLNQLCKAKDFWTSSPYT